MAGNVKLLAGNASIFLQTMYLFISIPRQKECSEKHVIYLMHLFLKQLHLIDYLSDVGPQRSFNSLILNKI